MASRGSRRRRSMLRRKVPLFMYIIGAAAVLGGLLYASLGPAHVSSNFNEAEEVLTRSAVSSLHDELPHKFQVATDHALQPIAKAIPDVSRRLYITALRRDFSLPGSGIVQVTKQQSRHTYRHWLALLTEVCSVLGFSTGDDAGKHEKGLDFEKVDTNHGPQLRCPELWVDEAWPPSPMAPARRHTPPLWSVAPADEQGQGLVVAQAKLLQNYPAAEIKALFGYELGRSLWGRLAMLPVGLGKRSAQAYLGMRLYSTWQHALDLEARSKQNIWQRFLSAQRSRQWHVGSSVASSVVGVFTGPAAPFAECAAIGVVLHRMVPRILQPIFFGGLYTQRHAVHGAFQACLGVEAPPPCIRSQQQQSSFFDWLWLQPPTLGERAAPWVQLAGEAGALQLMSSIRSMRQRSVVITLDRVAAVAAGDARAAAAALLRARGLLTAAGEAGVDGSRRTAAGATGQQLEDALDAYAARGQLDISDSRRAAMLKNAREPRPQVRVFKLFAWAETETGQRLLALGNYRRNQFSSGGWMSQLFGGFGTERGEGRLYSIVTTRSLGVALLGVLVLLPLLTHIDAVRWASMCTLFLTWAAMLQGMGYGGGSCSAFQRVLRAFVGILVGMYAYNIGSIWWNHLLGGSARWARLSAKLVDKFSDHADVTAGIAYLARGWAEMADRSMHALDQELCGSWRLNLSEVAHKLSELKEELVDAQSSSSFGVGGSRANTNRQLLPQLRGGDDFAISPFAPEAVSNMGRSVTPLWRKVDQAVQRAATIEASRMRRAADATDPKTLQAINEWWKAEDTTTAAPNSPGGPKILRAITEGGGAEADTLGALLVADKLHQRFQYPSFCGDDVPSPGNTAVNQQQKFKGSEEFRRLEAALATNFQSLQELRGRIAPWEDAKTALWGTWADIHGVYEHFQRVIRGPSRANMAAAATAVVSATAAASAAAAAASSGGAAAAMAGARHGAAAMGLPAATDELKDELAELRTLSCLFLAAFFSTLIMVISAVYLLSGWFLGSFCFFAANAVFLLNYSRLYLPHVRRRLDRRLEDLSKQREFLMQETELAHQASKHAGLVHIKASIFLQSVNVIRNINYLALCIKTEVLRAGESGMPKGQRQSIVTCGLQLLLAMLPHTDMRWRQDALYSENCSPAAALLYGRRRGECAVLSAGVSEAQKRLWILFRMVHLSTAMPEDAHGQFEALVDQYLRPVVVERRVPLGSMPVQKLEDEPAVEEKMSALKETASTASAPAADIGKNLMELVATRDDVAAVLKRLPVTALLGASQSEESDKILEYVFGAAIFHVILPTPTAKASCFGTVAIATGYSFDTSAYAFNTMETALLVKIAVPSNESASGVDEVHVRLTQLHPKDPGTPEVVAAWTSMSASLPAQFNDESLQIRRAFLKDAKDKLKRSRSTRKSAARK